MGWERSRALYAIRTHAIRRITILGSIALFAVTFAILPQRVGAAVPEVCKRDNGAFILKCPRTCGRACDNMRFKLRKQSYRDACDALDEIPKAQRKDKRGCEPPRPPNPFQACSRRVAAMPSYAQIVKRRLEEFKREIAKLKDGQLPEGMHDNEFDSEKEKNEFIQSLIAKYETRLSSKKDIEEGYDKWKCDGMQSTQALREYYKCISALAASRLGKYQNFSKKYRNMSTCFDLDKHGGTSSQLSADANRLHLLGMRVGKLTAKAQKANDCLNSIQTWHNDRINKCKTKDCQKEENDTIDKFNEEIEPLQKKRRSIQEILKGLPKRIEKIEDLVTRCN